MFDEVYQRFMLALAIHDDDSPSFSVMRSSSVPQQFFAIGRPLKRKIPDLKVVIGTLTSFYGRSLFVLAKYDGLEDVASVPIDSFPVWVEIKGLPDALMTDEVIEKVGWTLGQVEHVDQMNFRRGTRVRVRILQKLSALIKEAFGFVVSWCIQKRVVQMDRPGGGFSTSSMSLLKSVVNPFAGRNMLPKLSFSILGISATYLALKLDKLRTPPIVQSAPIAAPTVIVETPPVSTHTPIFGVKRGSELALVPFGK
ncbi:hypothetical protein ACLB2K_025114 [Fragaria x ananassa]